jgi:pimeloyl-ACP methyl ester carboxylesterase
MRAAARVAPALPVPFDAYLDIHRVCRDDTSAEYFYTDPLGRRTYPLRFIASLFAADLSGMRDGSISCPVTVIAGRGDPLFPLSYTRQVFGQIVAPRKDLLVVDSDVHLLFSEDLDTVLPPLLRRLHAVSPMVGEGGGYAPRGGSAAAGHRRRQRPAVCAGGPG